MCFPRGTVLLPCNTPSRTLVDCRNIQVAHPSRHMWASKMNIQFNNRGPPSTEALLVGNQHDDDDGQIVLVADNV